MESNFKPYNFEKSLDRIDEILNGSNSYDETDQIPAINELSYKNGKYVKCAAFFIDLRGSTDLIKLHGKKSRTLARVYKAYISEIVAIVNGFKTCREINIVGDCVSTIFSGKEEESELPVIEALEAAGMANAIMKVLNVKFKKKWDKDFEIKAGIGISLGRALVVKAGFNGSGINDLIYMGDVVNRASKMCGLAYKEYPNIPICVTEAVYEASESHIANKYTEETFQDYFTKYIHLKHGVVYCSDYYLTEINDWAKK